MLLFLAGFLIGGLFGALVMALLVASGERSEQLGRSTRTAASSPQSTGPWVIAGNGSVTSGSRLGRFSVERVRSTVG